MLKYILSLSLFFSMSTYANANLVCYGTEPFFQATLSSQEIKFVLIGTQGISDQVSNITQARGTRDFAYKIKTPNMSASVISGDCNDGMSDRIYSYHLLLEVGSELYYGCCNKLN